MIVMGSRKGAGSICVPVGFFLVGLFLTGAYGAAPDYPNRAITMIVPYPAGGVTDLAARALADAMEKHLNAARCGDEHGTRFSNQDP